MCLAHLLTHSEATNGPRCRVRLHSASGTTIILLNEEGLALRDFLGDLVGKAFAGSDVLEVAFSSIACNEISRPQKQKAWELLYDGTRLLIPTKKSAAKLSSPVLGHVIVGKEHLAGRTILAAELMSKEEPTPFVADEWGDSYNDSFYLEPRTIETEPSTVFKAVCDILDAGKLAFKQLNYEAAAAKYQKAFHYCHSYYPEDLSAEDLETAAKLKKQSLLNLALAAYKCNTRSRLNDAVESCDFVLEMPEASTSDKAKALYRRGQANLLRGDDELALSDFKESLKLLDDPATRKAVETCAKAREQRQAKLKRKMANAFGE